ncbi:MAG: YybS family protein [Turicibacter sp.]|nr:YybS family protein [Turicibacter sp.]
MKTRTLINAAMMLAIYLVFLMLYNLGIFSILVTIALPLPMIIFSVMSKKTSEIWMMFIGCLIGAYVTASLFGVLATVIYGGSGLVLGLSMVMGRPYWQRLLNGALVHVIGIPLMARLLSGINIGENLLETMNQAMDMTHQLMPTADLTAMGDTFQLIIGQLMPAVLLLTGLLSVFFSDKLAVFMLKRLGVLEMTAASWSDFQLGSLLAVIYMAAQLLHTSLEIPVLNTVLLNIILLLAILFAIQGIVVVSLVFKARSMSRIGVFVAVIMFLSGLSIILSMIGVMDALFNYRKRLNLRNGL